MITNQAGWIIIHYISPVHYKIQAIIIVGCGRNGIGNLKLSMVEAHPAESNIIFYYFIILLQARTASVFTVYFSTGSDHKLQAFKTNALLGPKSSYRINIDRDHLLLLRNECALLEL